MSEKKHEPGFILGRCEGWSNPHQQTDICRGWQAEPAASPQATRTPEAQQKLRDDVDKLINPQPSDGTTPQAERPACKHDRMAGHEWEQWCLDCGQRWPNQNPADYSTTVTLPARAVAPVETPQAAKLMVSRGGEIHEQCPDCRGECSPYKPAAERQRRVQQEIANGVCRSIDLLHGERGEQAVAPVETRLTAEQFWLNSPQYKGIAYADLDTDEWIEFAEAFRDKSESELEGENAGLRHRIHHLEQHNQYFFRCESAWCNPSTDNNPALETLKQNRELVTGLREEIERLDKENEVFRQLNEQLNRGIRELRAKLTEQEAKYTTLLNQRYEDMTEFRFRGKTAAELTKILAHYEAAKAELAALRERERSMRTCLETIRELGRVTMATETGREIILDSIGEALSAAPEA